MVRQRNNVLTRSKGFGSRNGVVFPGSGGQTFHSSHWCEDVIGPDDCQPLFIEHKSHEGGLINRPNSGSFGAKFIDYVADGLNSTIQDQSVLGVPSTTTAATMAAARTNPSRPYVDVPVSVFELRDLPALIHDQGRQVFRGALGGLGLRQESRLGRRSVRNQLGSGNLMYQFGIRPLAGDIARLMYFGEALERRTAELDRLDAEGGLRRTIRIGTYSSSGTHKWAVQSNGVFIEPTFQWNKVIEVKAHTRWVPNESRQAMHIAGQKRALAIRAMLGLGIVFENGGISADMPTITSQLWEAMPWSWLVDWGTTVGDYFMSQRNIVQASLDKCVISEHSTLTYSCPFYSAPPVSMTGIRTKWETKRRSPGVVAPTAHFPFLNGRQLGILGSLAVTRMR